MKFTEYLKLNESDSKSRTDKWTLDQIKNAKYKHRLDDGDNVYIKGVEYVKIGKDKWQDQSLQAHSIGRIYTDKQIYDIMNESAGKVKAVNSKELRYIIHKTIEEKGPNCDLNFIDTSDIRVMHGLFSHSNFNGDISKWDVSKVTDMSEMFLKSKFNGDISKWNVRNVEDMYAMFAESQFNGDISRWNTRNVCDMGDMFRESQFNGDISKWDIGDVEGMPGMFRDSKFDRDISRWKISSDVETSKMFKGCPLEKKPEFQPKFED